MDVVQNLNICWGVPFDASFEVCLVSWQRDAVTAPAVRHWILWSLQNPHKDSTDVPVLCPGSLPLVGTPGPHWGRGLWLYQPWHHSSSAK